MSSGQLDKTIAKSSGKTSSSAPQNVLLLLKESRLAFLYANALEEAPPIVLEAVMETKKHLSKEIKDMVQITLKEKIDPKALDFLTRVAALETIISSPIRIAEFKSIINRDEELKEIYGPDFDKWVEKYVKPGAFNLFLDSEIERRHGLAPDRSFYQSSLSYLRDEDATASHLHRLARTMGAKIVVLKILGKDDDDILFLLDCALNASKKPKHKLRGKTDVEIQPKDEQISVKHIALGVDLLRKSEGVWRFPGNIADVQAF